jgi:hypothetical protein
MRFAHGPHPGFDPRHLRPGPDLLGNRGRQKQLADRHSGKFPGVL